MDLVNLDVTISDEFHCYTELFVEVSHGRYHGHLAGNQFLWNDRNWTVGYAYQTHGSPGSTEPNRRLDGVGQASTFDDGICAGAPGALQDDVGCRLRRNRQVSPELSGQSSSTLVGLYDKHFIDSVRFCHLKHRQANRTSTLNHNKVSRSYTASSNSVHRDRRRLDLRSLHVAERRFGRNNPFCRNADCRSEPAMVWCLCVATSGDRPDKTTLVLAAMVAMVASSTSRRHGDDNSVSFAEPTNVSRDGRNDTHPFMPTNCGGIGPA